MHTALYGCVLTILMATKNNTVEVTKFAPMVARTRDQLADLCTPESAHNWTLCYAEKQNGPPSKSKSFAKVVVGELEDPPLRDNVKHIIREVGQALEDIFCSGSPTTPSVVHNVAFWDQFYHSVVFAMGASLSKRYKHENEEQVRHDLLSPLLERAANSASLMYAAEINRDYESGLGIAEYICTFSLETTTEARQGQRGRKPSVDYAITGFVHGEPLYFIPIEAKSKMCIGHMVQLSHYMSTTSNSRYRTAYASVGVLIDQTDVVFAFSMLTVRHETGDIPAPIVLLSPRKKWRNGCIVEKPMCIALCLLHLFKVKRTVLNEEVWRVGLGDDAWSTIVQQASEVYQHTFEQTESFDVYGVVKRLEERVSVLEEEKEASRLASMLIPATSTPLCKRRRTDHT